MYHYIIKNKATMLRVLFIVPVASLCSILFALSLEPVLTAAIAGNYKNFFKASLLCFLLCITDLLLGLFVKRNVDKLIHQSSYQLREAAIHKIFQKSFFEFQKKDTSRYLTLFSNDIPLIEEMYFKSICSIYQTCWSFLISIITILFLNPWLLLLLLFIGGLSLFLPSRFENSLRKRQETQITQAERNLRFLKDLFQGFFILKNHSVEAVYQKRYQAIDLDFTNAEFEASFYPYKVAWISMSLSSIAFIGTMISCAYFVLTGSFTVGLLLALSQMIGSILMPFEELPQYLAQLKGVKHIIAEFHQLLDDNSLQEQFNFIPDFSSLKFEHIHFSYPEQIKYSIEDLSISIRKGGKYAIVGPSGSGKTTLAKILAGIFPANFSLLIDGTLTVQNSTQELVSYLGQETFLFCDTIFNNIDLFQDKAKEQVAGILRNLKFPLEAGEELRFLNTSVGEGGTKLSGGERQRIGLARELLHPKKILILDEFTSNLDNLTAGQLEQLVLNSSDFTCIFITHRLNPELLKACDQIFYLSSGNITEHGTFEDLLKQQGAFFHLYYGVENK